MFKTYDIIDGSSPVLHQLHIADIIRAMDRGHTFAEIEANPSLATTLAPLPLPADAITYSGEKILLDFIIEGKKKIYFSYGVKIGDTTGEHEILKTGEYLTLKKTAYLPSFECQADSMLFVPEDMTLTISGDIPSVPDLD